MAWSESDAEMPGLGSVLTRGWRELMGAQGRKFLRNLSRALLWQALGKLLQVVGLGYAFRCLGPEKVGLSGTVIVVAAFGQLVLDFGLEIVSVRHAAAKTVRLEELIPAMFSLRLAVATAAALVWLATVLLLPLAPTTRWVWALGAPYLFFLSLNFSWFYQATERVHRFALIQNVTTVATSACFLACFRPGQAAGSDLLVTMLMNGIATVAVWWHIKREQRVRLIQASALSLAKALLVAGRPTWSFNLCYSALASVSLPLCYWLLGQRESGYYRSAAMIVFSLQVFLVYFAYMLNPRIVAWRHEAPGRFRARVLLVAGGTAAAGVVVFGLLWLVGEVVIGVLCGPDFLPAAALLPVLVFAKFLAVASGVLVWAMFASQRDWWAVLCCLPSLSIGVVASWLLIPRYGTLAAAWTYWLMELGLLLVCLGVFSRMEVQAKSSA
jgi:O-antigen/teichoic acid export membrane protein